jgi:23S rRNA-/tRNA-specific pseudouridylate synthase
VASFLSKAWRERDQVSKHYLAVVHYWPPYHDKSTDEGVINAPLSPSDERLKWKVVDGDEGGGKPSTTEWKVFRVLSSRNKDKGNNDSPTKTTPVTERRPLILELKPITGRTHQLRIHCAHIGSGIDGDSLYGANRVDFDSSSHGKLKLHAWKLSFPHPNGKEVCEFSCDPTWMTVFDET